MGVVSVASRIGAASSPFVVQMTRINAILPFAVMGSLSFLAAVFCWILPETMGKSTAEVMEDAKKEAGILFLIVIFKRNSHVVQHNRLVGDVATSFIPAL